MHHLAINGRDVLLVALWAERGEQQIVGALQIDAKCHDVVTEVPDQAWRQLDRVAVLGRWCAGKAAEALHEFALIVAQRQFRLDPPVRAQGLPGADAQHLAGGVEIVVGKHRLAPVRREFAGKQGAGCLGIVVEPLHINVAAPTLVIDLQARIETLHAAGVALAVVVVAALGCLHAEADLLVQPLGDSGQQLPAIVAATSQLRAQAARIRSSRDHVDQSTDGLVAV